MLRPALLEDIPAMHALRLGVRENRLSDPSKVTQADYERRLAQPGASWIVEVNGSIAGFAIADFPSRSVWALFVQQCFEGQGIGRSLLQQVTQSLEAAGPGTIHLSTEEGTRAARLYAAAGWTRHGQLPNGEIHFMRAVRALVTVR
jgi:ribosomal protein S18 acetylase RimI-like enzyme